MPIILAPINEEVTIVRVIAEEKTKKHLESLGISNGRKVVVLQVSNGNVILLIGNTRLALDKDLASKIFIG
ncbi:MAG: ferrous iron transport protein A [Gammaproteobacteria bacterium]|nr:ferrous iron transport protein A [Gammaproteobacteria bacterium]